MVRRSLAGQPAGGKSEHDRTRWWLTTTGPGAGVRDSATENKPPPQGGKGETVRYERTAPLVTEEAGQTPSRASASSPRRKAPVVRRMGRVACSELSGNGSLREMIVTRKGTEFGLRPDLRRMGQSPCTFALPKLNPDMNLCSFPAYRWRLARCVCLACLVLPTTTCCGSSPRMTQQMG